MEFHQQILLAGQIMEGLGVAAIVGGSVIAAIFVVVRRLRQAGWQESIREFRQNLGQAILLGLEFLVGADIIRTVSEIPTLEEVLVLAFIVLIRTFLSFTLEVELEGHWPWQRRAAARHGDDRP